MELSNISGIAEDTSSSAFVQNIDDETIDADVNTMYKDDTLTYIFKDNSDNYYYANLNNTGKIAISNDPKYDPATYVKKEESNGGTVENPKTGISDYIYLIGLASIGVILTLLVSKNIKKL